jgi:Dyp-type peroxidase family
MAETPVKTKPTTADLADIQGLVYSGWGEHAFGGYLFATLGDPTRSREWLAEVRELVSPASVSKKADGDRLNIALSPHGLQKLGVPAETYAALPQEAKRGMQQRARILDDDDPAEWELGKDGELDVLLMIFARDNDRRTELLDWHRKRLVAAGATVRPAELTHHLGGKEHFGFADGVSQPFIAGKLDTPPNGESVLPTGEILLGYANAYGKPPASPKWGELDFGHNGSYLVFRKLHQHVELFWQWVVARANELEPHDPAAAAYLTQRLAAKLVGRWKSGASLVHAKDHDDPDAARPERANAFGYFKEDRFGDACPVSSHARRANPRDARGDNPKESLEVVNRHRILRRGRSYGLPMPDADALAGHNDGQPRGLYFISLQSSIARGFEFIQQTWLSNPGFNGLFCEPDPIMGNAVDFAVTVPCTPVRMRLKKMPSVVTVKGGGYFFLPSLTALARLAGAS